MIKMPHVISMMDDLLSISKGIVIKRQDLADPGELLEITRQADYYVQGIEKTDNFFSYIKFPSEVLINAGLTSQQVIDAQLSKNNIPEDLRSGVLQQMRLYTQSKYVEKNNYYRTLNGLPDINDTLALYIYEAVDGVDISKPMHKMTDGEIFILNEKGIIAKLIEKYPKKIYLKYLGKHRISIYKARKARMFDVLDIGSYKHSYHKDIFMKNYELARRYILNSEFQPELFSNYPDYFAYIGLLMLNMTMMLCLDNSVDKIVTKEYYDAETISYNLKSFNMDIFNDIPLTFRKAISDNIERLIRFKGKDKIYSEIYRLFGFDTVDVYKYFISKEVKRDVSGDPIYTGTDDQKYNILMNQINIESPDVGIELRNVANRLDYDTVVYDDPYWGVYESNQDVKDKLLAHDFNYFDSKYISLTSAYDVVAMNYEINYVMNSLLAFKTYESGLGIYMTNVNLNVNIFDVIVYLFALISRRSHFAGNIPSTPADVATIYRFNYEASIAGMQSIFDRYKDVSLDLTGVSISQPIDALSTPMEILRFYLENKRGVYELLTTAMSNTKDKQEYLLAGELLKYLTTSKQTTSIYTKSNGTVASTFKDYLTDQQPLLNTYLDSLTDDKLGGEITNTLQMLEEYIDDGSLKYLFTKVPIVDEGLIKGYIEKVINIFKSYTVEIDNMNVIYKIDDHIKHNFKIMDDVYRDKKNYNSDIIPMYSDINTHINNTFDDRGMRIFDEVEIEENIKGGSTL